MGRECAAWTGPLWELAGSDFSWATLLLNLLLTQVNTTIEEHLLWAGHMLR